MNKKLRIRNSTAEFLTFVSQNEGNSIEVRLRREHAVADAAAYRRAVRHDKTKCKSAYTKHHIRRELAADATVKDFLTVRQEGDRQVSRTLEYYNLDMIIAVGYRVNSKRADGVPTVGDSPSCGIMRSEGM